VNVFERMKSGRKQSLDNDDGNAGTMRGGTTRATMICQRNMMVEELTDLRRQCTAT
jgi:hypothetical protein